MARKNTTITDDLKDLNINLNDIENMAGMGLTQEEIAYIKGIKPQSLTRLKQNHPEIGEAILRGKAVDKKAKIERIREIIDKEELDNTVLSAIRFYLSIVHDIHEKQERIHSGSFIDNLEKKLNELGVKAIDKISNP